MAQSIVAAIGYAFLVIAAGCSIVTLIASVAWRAYASRRRQTPAVLPPVTILKPLCGGEPGLYEHLRTFCVQQYPQYQIVFGTLDAADPALAVGDGETERRPAGGVVGQLQTVDGGGADRVH